MTQEVKLAIPCKTSTPPPTPPPGFAPLLEKISVEMNATVPPATKTPPPPPELAYIGDHPPGDPLLE
jgi:hypothetical protein